MFVSAGSSACAFIWSGINDVRVIANFSSASGWFSMGLILFVALPCIFVTFLGGLCPAFYSSAALLPPTRRRLVNFSLVSIATALLSGLLGLVLSAR